MEKTVEIKKEDQKTIDEMLNDGTQCLTQKEVDELVAAIKKKQGRTD
jgi:hypothetical protein